MLLWIATATAALVNFSAFHSLRESVGVPVFIIQPEMLVLFAEHEAQAKIEFCLILKMKFVRYRLAAYSQKRLGLVLRYLQVLRVFNDELREACGNC